MTVLIRQAGPVPSALPLGDPAPPDGLLPAQALRGRRSRAFGLYVHIPFCAVRCGYCDFNTYTATELGGGASQDAYAGTAVAEVDFAAAALKRSGLPARPLSTVFFGGGTPTLLPGRGPGPHPHGRHRRLGPAPGAEVTTEANPDSVTPESLQLLADAGFTRVSFGMQSAVPHVLKVLDRTHTPSRVPQVVQWARDAGLAVSLDLIYGTPGESLDDWRYSLETALSYAPDHISAYALIVEDGTKLAAQIRRGEVPESTTTTTPPSTSWPTNSSRPPGCPGTRSATGPAPRSRPAGTTSPTGAATTGGASGPARTPTSAACAGGTSSTPPPTPTASDRGLSPAAGRETLDSPRPATWSASCWRPA